MKIIVLDNNNGNCKIFEGIDIIDIINKELTSTGEFFGFKQSELEENKNTLSEDASDYLKLLTDQNLRNYYILRCLIFESYLNDDIIFIDITNENKPYRFFI